MRKILSRLESYIRCCANCGAWLTPVDLFCEACWQKYFNVQRNPPLFVNHQFGFPVYSLFLWTHLTPCIPLLIHRLKGGNVRAPFDRLARLFIMRYIATTMQHRALESTQLIFVPSPPSAKAIGGHDHATQWATALSSLTGIAVLYLLRRRSQTESQKRKDRSHRWHGRDQLFEKAEKAPWASLTTHHSRVIFIDDVVTTGATALAAYERLDRPSSFEVWTIASREKDFV